MKSKKESSHSLTKKGNHDDTRVVNTTTTVTVTRIYPTLPYHARLDCLLTRPRTRTCAFSHTFLDSNRNLHRYPFFIAISIEIIVFRHNAVLTDTRACVSGSTLGLFSSPSRYLLQTFQFTLLLCSHTAVPVTRTYSRTNVLFLPNLRSTSPLL